MDLRDRSCRLRCSLRLKARLQYWHLYFFSGAAATFFGVFVVAVAAALAASAAVASDWAMAGVKGFVTSPPTRRKPFARK
jgi:hypothetical protein